MNCHTLSLLVVAALPGIAAAHSWKAGDQPVFNEDLRAHLVADWEQEHGAKQDATPRFAALGAAANVGKAPAQAGPFVAFAPKVNVKWDRDYLYVESDGIPAHNMMIGITAWQQQVPLPQSYFGDNAWRIPLHPVVAAQPAMIKGRFLRGAIALAANGIPIFNPQNNRGEVSQEIGELDQWGGHCGRADDYHYHIAPLHLQNAVGKGMPVAFALDGYPIYGLAEPDGSAVGALDECHGHETAGAGYHYHASMKYPYVLGGFHGEVVEAEGQVDPQPRARGVREALQALRGAEITGFESTGANSYKLSYTVGADKRSVSYKINADGTFPFEFDNGRDGKSNELYTARQGGGGGGPGGGKGKGKGKGDKGGPGGKGGGRPDENRVARGGEDRRTPPAPATGTLVIMDLNGDGIVSAVEFAESAKRGFAQGGKGGTLADALQKAREQFSALDRNHDGQLDRGELAPVVAADTARQSGNPPLRERDEPPQREGKKGGTDGKGGPGGGGGGRGGKDGFVPSPDQPRSSNGTFMLSSSAVEDLKEMPADFTGAGSGATLPLEWKGAPAGTQGYALIMDHTDPQGQKKWYWTVYDIPASVTSLPKNVQGVGKVGTGFKGQIGYEPVHSHGPGPKTYVLTLYALSGPLNLTQSPSEVNREVLLAAMKDKVLASSSLRVVHTSSGDTGPGGGGEKRPRREERSGGGERPSQPVASNDRPAAPSAAVPGGLRPVDNIFSQAGGTQVAQNSVKPPEPPPAPGGDARPPAPGAGDGKGKGKGGPGGKGGPDNKGLIKPAMSDTVHIDVYADNWFAMFINGELVAVDSIKFTPHNVVSLDILPEYPMTIAVIAKDNADWNTGMEYGDHIGDGGFIVKFSDGTVSNAKWKAMSYFKGPLDHDAKNPKVVHTPIPDGWWKVGFDDSKWPFATEYTEERVNPKEPYFKIDFSGARFIWSEDLDLDNTILFRTVIEKPGWVKRWNTKPDIDISGAPFK
jgi:phosphatidylethanolamine-binding protein (PEBP) family uncharacterized protein